ncbi:MAG TPA: hypothetical protein VLV78_21290 [Thermoanaerobaculia bacterium]|nr:hypothetical protein [Thermoanaerobaculia bacterium]
MAMNRTSESQSAIAVLLCTTLMMLGWPVPASRLEAQPKKIVYSKNYSGEDLFRGIFFAEGDIAAKVPELRRLREAYGLSALNDKQKAAVRHLQDELIAQIKKADASYFTDFQAEIQSGNQVRVLAKLKEAGRLVWSILYDNNPGVAPLLDNTKNQRFKERLGSSAQVVDLRSKLPSAVGTRDVLKDLNRQIIIDREIYLYKITQLDTARIRFLDFDLNREIDVNRYADINKLRSFAINSHLDIFRFLDIDRNFNNHFDRVAVNRFADAEYNPVGDVTVDIETAIYAVVAVAVFVAAVAVLVVGRSDIFNDRAGLLTEQLVNSIAVNLRVQHDVRTNAPYR